MPSPKDKKARPQKRRSRYCVLSPRFDGQPIHLGAFKLAQRVFWAQAVAGRDESLDTIYERILALYALHAQ